MRIADFVQARYASNVPSGYDLPMRDFLLVGLTAAFLFGCATATRPPIPSGTVPVLAEGEGLLIIDVDTDIAIKRIAAGRGVAAENLAKGRHTWIVRAPAGTYRWQDFEVGVESSRAVHGSSTRGDEECEFEVVAGSLNYPGELIIRSDYMWRSSGQGIWVRSRDHSAMAVRALRKTHAATLDAFPLRYAGTSEDGFLAHYTMERETASSDPPPPVRPIAVAAPSSGVSAEQLFSSDGVHRVGLSPSGQWAFAHVQNGEIHGVLVQKVGSSEIESAIATRSRLISLYWIGPDRFLASFSVSRSFRYVVGHVREAQGEIAIDMTWLDAPGNFVDPLPLNGKVVIWEFEDEGRNSINRVEIGDLVGFKKRHRGSYDPTSTGEKLALVRGTIVNWIVDRNGEPRAAVRRDKAGYTILVQRASGGFFRELYKYLDEDEERTVWPLSLSADGKKLIVAAYDGNNTLGIVELDMRTGDFGRTVFRREGVDVSEVVLDFIDRELIAAVYEEGGDRRYHYFDSVTSRKLGKLEGLLPRETVSVASGSVDRRVLVLSVSGDTNPGSFYLHDTRTGRSTAIGERLSRVDRKRLQQTQTLTVESKDGTKIEAFLTMPDPKLSTGKAGVPLIVYPHGGPIGVRDSKRYDPIVQYLASWGFASLQVNYRGSSGYGLDFEAAGKQQWAQGIEDDIDAVVERAMARPDIDESRICIMGGSYGGFSSLASVVRHKDRYRCAATINGATDIPLLFDTSDTADYEKGLKELSAVAGDIETDREKLMEISPVYNVSEMHVPVFVAYGTEDRRVDPDHSHRLLLMLETYGKAHRSLEIRGGSHSPTQREWVILVRALRKFMTENLYSPGTFIPDPASESPAFDLLLKIES